MRRHRILTGVAVISALTLMAGPTAADPQLLEYFTDFEDVNPNTAIGEIIVVGVAPETAELGGDAFGGVVGLGQLYHSGLRAWMVVENGTGFIDFEPDAAEVEFFATAHSAADGSTVITAFDASDVMVGSPVTLTPGSGFQLVSFSGAIASIEVVNNASNQMNGIDDFGFTPVPEPADGPLVYAGSVALAVIARRRRTERRARNHRSACLRAGGTGCAHRRVCSSPIHGGCQANLPSEATG